MKIAFKRCSTNGFCYLFLKKKYFFFLKENNFINIELHFLKIREKKSEKEKAVRAWYIRGRLRKIRAQSHQFKNEAPPTAAERCGSSKGGCPSLNLAVAGADDSFYCPPSTALVFLFLFHSFLSFHTYIHIYIFWGLS